MSNGWNLPGDPYLPPGVRQVDIDRGLGGDECEYKCEICGEEISRPGTCLACQEGDARNEDH